MQEVLLSECRRNKSATEVVMAPLVDIIKEAISAGAKVITLEKVASHLKALGAKLRCSERDKHVGLDSVAPPVAVFDCPARWDID